jgi:hypothetical protein
MPSTADNPIYTLQDMPGKGKGLIAIKNISKGTRNLSKEPIITVPLSELDSDRLKNIYQPASGRP